ncbi:MAG: hypothetical protein H7329_06535 [Opitutaceae bacterium]|nr:hypothetical protein [Cytophagales bacterium]
MKAQGYQRILLYIGILFVQDQLYAQRFYLKPSISYNFGVRNKELHYQSHRSKGSFNETHNLLIEENQNALATNKEQHYPKIAFGSGKTIGLEIGYETAGKIIYLLNFEYGISDKFQRQFSSYNLYLNDINGKSSREYQWNGVNIVSMYSIGIQPGIGYYKNLNSKTRLSGSLSGYLGLARIQIIQSGMQEQRVKAQIEDHFTNPTLSVQVLKGSLMYGMNAKVHMEKTISKKSSIGLYASCSPKWYSPNKVETRHPEGHANFAGSYFLYTTNSDYSTQESLTERPVYSFAAVSIGIEWKWIFQKSNTSTSF